MANGRGHRWRPAHPARPVAQRDPASESASGHRCRPSHMILHLVRRGRDGSPRMADGAPCGPMCSASEGAPSQNPLSHRRGRNPPGANPMRTHGRRPKDSARDRWQCASCLKVKSGRSVHINGIDYCRPCSTTITPVTPTARQTGLHGICATCGITVDGTGVKSKLGKTVHGGGCPRKARSRGRPR